MIMVLVQRLVNVNVTKIGWVKVVKKVLVRTHAMVTASAFQENAIAMICGLVLVVVNKYTNVQKIVIPLMVMVPVNNKRMVHMPANVLHSQQKKRLQQTLQQLRQFWWKHLQEN